MSEQLIQPEIKVWECKIGGKIGDLPMGADAPMRAMIEKAFYNLTGKDADFLFSGWGGSLDEIEDEIAYG